MKIQYIYVAVIALFLSSCAADSGNKAITYLYPINMYFYLLQHISKLPNCHFTLIGSAKHIDVHKVFHDILKTSPDKTARSITMQLISRSDDGPTETSSIQLAGMDTHNKFVPTSSSADPSDGDITVR